MGRIDEKIQELENAIRTKQEQLQKLYAVRDNEEFDENGLDKYGRDYERL